MHGEDFTTAQLLKSASRYPVSKGDVPGHVFHGNQWREGYSSFADYQQKAAKAVKDYVAKGKVAIKINVQPFRQVLKDGELKNGFVTHSLLASHAGGTRMELENRFFGHTNDSPVENRPIYGLIDQKGSSDEEDLYGSVKLVLKDEVKDRTTVTVGDSNRTLGVGDPKENAWTTKPLSATNPDPKDISEVPTAKGYDIFQAIEEARTNGMRHLDFDKVPYIEAQIHGGVKLSDIESVEFAEHPGKQMLAKLDSLGIPYSLPRNP